MRLRAQTSQKSTSGASRRDRMKRFLDHADADKAYDKCSNVYTVIVRAISTWLEPDMVAEMAEFHHVTLAAGCAGSAGNRRGLDVKTGFGRERLALVVGAGRAPGGLWSRGHWSSR